MLEKVILVAIKKPKQDEKDFQSRLEEIKLLSKTAGAKPVKILTQVLDKPRASTYIGKGKSEELSLLVRSGNIDAVIFNEQLSPVQERNLSTMTDVKIIDRTALILDIFATHAHSKEGKIQVALAQYNYLLPRLTGKGIALSRLGGGIGTRGPGETKLEADRRRIRKHIRDLKKELEKVSTQRGVQRKKRSKNIFKVSLVGYTNSGKSTLLNRLTKASVETADKLFTTLDSTTRRLYIEGTMITVSDTVGFIDKLPTLLIEAFKSTLIEVIEADMIIHVVDSANADVKNQIKAVEKILKEIGVHKPPLLVLNKIDLSDASELKRTKEDHREAIMISALKGFGIERLKRKIGISIRK